LLAQKGIRNFTLADPDAWDKTSMHRVWIPPSHINRNKAESLAEIVGERGINARALPFKEESVPPSELDADILIIATDSISSRIIGNNLAIELRRPAVIVGTEIGPHNQQTMVGECRVYLPEKTPCYRCNLSVDPLQLARETENPENWRKFASKYGLPLDSDPVPSLVDLNTMVASLASDEVTKIITGIHEPIPHQYIDFLNRRLIRIEATRNPECPSCRQVEAVQLGDSDIIQTETALKAPTA
jgi:molybdopterin/thiamine biosynthesis adenylyltransferase